MHVPELVSLTVNYANETMVQYKSYNDVHWQCKRHDMFWIYDTLNFFHITIYSNSKNGVL